MPVRIVMGSEGRQGSGQQIWDGHSGGRTSSFRHSVQAGNTPLVLVEGFFEDRIHSQDGLSFLLEMADAKTVLCTTAKHRSVSP